MHSRGPINIPTGTHTLYFEEQERRPSWSRKKMFSVDSVDQSKTVDVNRPFVPSPGSKERGRERSRG